QFFSMDQRPKISGYLTAGMAGAYTVGAILAATATDFRHISLFVLFPLSAIALALVWKGIPSKDLTIQRNPLYAFREVFRDRSAVMCLVSNTLAYMGPNTSWVTFFVPFFLQTFHADQAAISIVFLAATLLLIAGTIVGGRLVNRVGRKPLWSSMIGAASLACFGYIFAPNFELSVALWILAGFLFGISMPAYTSLLLEHVPEYRGTVMSLSETSQFIAQALGSGGGAVILLTYGFAGLGWFSLTGIIAAVLSYFFTSDPTKTS
ncbi:MAG: MFS transporter, partial [Candidatus Bathyarchaeota archaeon]|nr:MFS transporter [Candidatus Bathyarchaeota archaeon]